MELSRIKPYTSLTLARVSTGREGPALLKEILNEIEKLLDFAAPKAARRLIGRNGPVKNEDLTVGSLHYVESRRPGWTSDSETKDVINQIVVVCQRGSHVAIVLTDTAWCRPLVKRFTGISRGLSALEPIKMGTLNAAFAEGAARTLWLSGIHVRTSVKADSKVLIGEDLRNALDPLGDQSYYFTAARCITKMGKRVTPVGVTPRQSRVWIGPSRSWDDFRDYVSGVFDCLKAVEKKRQSDDAPIPILAAPVSGLEDVRDAFDIGVIAPEVAAEDSDEETLKMYERWAYEARFDVVSAKGANLVADIWLGQTRLGSLDMQVDLSNPADVRYEITPKFNDGQEDLLKEFIDLCKNRRWFQIRYESGHTLSNGMLYSSRLRDFRFDNWRFPDFTGFDICKEKPPEKKKGGKKFSPDAVGSGDSLFCWVVNNWPDLEGTGKRRGWLACDDGAMEIADFIHLDTSMSPPLLSLIHVKGSHGSGPGRSVSVSDYEVVTAQAQKNLRSLDKMILGAGLAQGLNKEIGKLVWLDGKRQTGRTGFLAALREVGENLSRRVVILQPRLSRDVLESVRAEKKGTAGKKSNKPSGGAIRLMQLETMLVGAQNACRTLGADFWVVADGTPVPPQAPPASPGRTPRRQTPRGGNR
ncbi:MAG: hypothetical protein ABSG19_00165 [Candidatus Aminicenantales bacterium]